MLCHDTHMAGLVPDWFLLNTTVDCGEDLRNPAVQINALKYVHIVSWVSGTFPTLFPQGNGTS